jgi:hypothetical protein
VKIHALTILWYWLTVSIILEALLMVHKNETDTEVSEAIVIALKKAQTGVIYERPWEEKATIRRHSVE